jgi:hypothetical protein
VLIDGSAVAVSDFFCRARQIFAGIIALFQENLTQHGEKIAADTVFSNL